MKKFALALLVSALVVSGVALAQQSDKQEEGSRMQGMMEEMMKSGKGNDHMDGMMRMMKMMDQCGAMMESSQNSEETKQNQK